MSGQRPVERVTRGWRIFYMLYGMIALFLCMYMGGFGFWPLSLTASLSIVIVSIIAFLDWHVKSLGMGFSIVCVWAVVSVIGVIVTYL